MVIGITLFTETGEHASRRLATMPMIFCCRARRSVLYTLENPWGAGRSFVYVSIKLDGARGNDESFVLGAAW